MITSDQPRERLSQFLPTVKCSSCLQPVPLSQLGEHRCEAPPPIPTTPKPVIPPSSSSTTERDWLPVRVASPAISVRSTASSKHLQPASSPPRQDPSSNRLRIDTATRGPPSPTHSTFRPSPLARSADAADRLSTSSPKPGPSMRDSHALLSSPLRTRVDPPHNLYNQNHQNTNNGGSAQSTPSTARPLLSFNQEYTPTRELGPPRARGSPQSGFPSGPRLTQGMPLPPRAPQPQPAMNMNVGPPPTNVVPFPRRPSVPGSGGTPPPPPVGYPRRPGLPGPIISVPAPPPPHVMMMMGPRQGPSPRMATASFPAVRPDDTVKSGEAFIPPMERGIDMSSGGEAGMAGVGRRGFAAAARAAMFVTPGPRPMGPQPQPNYTRKQMVPQHLDLKAARQATETPPLSAGSGYSSSLSPGPTSPLPQPDVIFSQHQQGLPRLHTTPSPPSQQYRDASAPIPIKTSGPSAIPPPGVKINGNRNSNGNVSSPNPPHLPFFEKYKNSNFPGMGPQTVPNDTKALLPTANTMNQSARAPITHSSGSASVSVGASSASNGRGNPAAPSSSTDSDYSGLAYADSTDYEDNESERRGRSLTSPRGAPLKESILRSMSNSKAQFGSVSERSRSNDSVSRVRVNAARSTLRSEMHSESHSKSNSPARPHSRNHSRNNSLSSSYSSNASEDGVGRARSNSSVIAHALGLSQTPPSGYAKLGGPGVYNVEGRLARSGSSKSISSHSGRSHSGTDGEEQATPALAAKIAEVPKMIIKPVASSASSSRSGLSIALRERAKYEAEEDNHVGTKPKAQRSNTLQVVVQAQSPDVKSVKLPTRAQSEREKEKPLVVGGETKGGHGHGLPKKEKVKKSKVCLKCAVAIESGRWVSTDGGGVLCEKCWKNMYLPKCRRCNLPIERQAVSSSDGQLKGKYHKECFNCHECHKSFPDKTFYVYDGKPLCAYHYHEANDSLCAAARCGQPIEGPCAVSHTGDRYHPEHMTCEYPGSECGERLREYWEVEGRMLCERHAVHASRVGNDDEERAGSGTKGMKRVTRFIDLTGGINSPAIK